jgi:hypothetical protein
MKILIDPNLAVLARDLSDKEKAELLMCILEYPERESDLGLWKYMKKQIDLDAQKYREKCDRIAISRQKKSELKSTLKSEMESDLFLGVKEVVVSKDNIIKEKDNCKVSVSSNGAGNVENPVDNFLISGDFSIELLCKRNPRLAAYLNLYLPAVLEGSQKTLIEKCLGQWLTLSQLLEWIEQESLFYKQNHGGAQ